MWALFAILSAVFAALTTILAKLGMGSVNSNLATAIRTGVVLLLAWGIVWFTGSGAELKHISQKSWLFLILSGLATGASWLCYFKAVQLGTVTQVAPIDKLSVVFTVLLAAIIFRESITLKSAIGIICIAAGTLCMVL